RWGEHDPVRVGGDGVEGVGFGEVEGPDGEAAERAEVRAAAEGGAEVGGEGADVGAGAALDEDRDDRVWAGFELLDVEAIDADGTRSAFDLLAASGQVVEATPTHLQGADHRWNL